MNQEPYLVDVPTVVNAELIEQQRRERGLWAWSLLDGLIIIAVLIVLTVPLIGYFLYIDGVFNYPFGSAASNTAIQKTLESVQQQTGRTVALLAVQEAVMAGVVLFRIRVLRGLPFRWLGLTLDRFGRNVGFGVLLGILAFGANWAISAVFEQFGQHSNQSDLFPISQGDYLGQIIFFVAAAMVVPFVEELLFRGYIFKAWLRRWPTPVAYLASAVIFSLPHLAGITEGQTSLLVPIFAIALVLAWGFHRTQSLVPGVVAHMINNGIAMAGLIFCTNVGCK